MSNLELKPCPFCGGEACCMVLSFRRGERYCCECLDCVQTQTQQYITPQEAINAWNNNKFVPLKEYLKDTAQN